MPGSLTRRTRSYHDGSVEGGEERKGRAEEITEPVTAMLCREPSDEEFHTAVCGVTKTVCCCLWSAGTLMTRCLARQHVCVMCPTFRYMTGVPKQFMF